MSESRGFHLNLVSTGIAVACCFAFFRLLFRVFDPSEFLTMAPCVLMPPPGVRRLLFNGRQII